MGAFSEGETRKKKQGEIRHPAPSLHLEQPPPMCPLRPCDRGAGFILQILQHVTYNRGGGILTPPAGDQDKGTEEMRNTWHGTV